MTAVLVIVRPDRDLPLASSCWLSCMSVSAALISWTCCVSDSICRVRKLRSCFSRWSLFTRSRYCWIISSLLMGTRAAPEGTTGFFTQASVAVQAMRITSA